MTDEWWIREVTMGVGLNEMSLRRDGLGSGKRGTRSEGREAREMEVDGGGEEGNKNRWRLDGGRWVTSGQWGERVLFHDLNYMVKLNVPDKGRCGILLY